MKFISNVKGFENKNGYLFIGLDKDNKEDSRSLDDILSYQANSNLSRKNELWQYICKFPESFHSRVNENIIKVSLFYTVREKKNQCLIIAFGSYYKCINTVYYEDVNIVFHEANLHMLKKVWALFLLDTHEC